MGSPNNPPKLSSRAARVVPVTPRPSKARVERQEFEELFAACRAMAGRIRSLEIRLAQAGALLLED